MYCFISSLTIGLNQCSEKWSSNHQTIHFVAIWDFWFTLNSTKFQVFTVFSAKHEMDKTNVIDRNVLRISPCRLMFRYSTCSLLRKSLVSTVEGDRILAYDCMSISCNCNNNNVECHLKNSAYF